MTQCSKIYIHRNESSHDPHSRVRHRSFSRGVRRANLLHHAWRCRMMTGEFTKGTAVRPSPAMFAIAVWIFAAAGVVGSPSAQAQTAPFTIHRIADGDYA